MAYAQSTTVSVEKSKMEVERILTRYGAHQFVGGWDQGHKQAFVQFDMNNRRIRFLLKMPDVEGFRFYRRKGAYSDTERTLKQAEHMLDQEMRRRWRALALVVKAKLEAVESGISEFEHEFLANIVTSSGKTVGEMLVPKLNTISDTGKLPNLLLPGRAEE